MKRDRKRERRRIPHQRWTNMFRNPISKISGQFIAWLRRICTVFSAIWPIPRGKCFLDPILSKTIYNLAKSWAIFTTIGLKLQSPIGKGRKSITRFGPSLPGLTSSATVKASKCAFGREKLAAFWPTFGSGCVFRPGKSCSRSQMAGLTVPC